MQSIKPLLFVFAMLQVMLCSSQDYMFIPENQHLLSDEQISIMQIMITPDVFLFNEQGKILPMSQMELIRDIDVWITFTVISSAGIPKASYWFSITTSAHGFNTLPAYRFLGNPIGL